MRVEFIGVFGETCTLTNSSEGRFSCDGDELDKLPEAAIGRAIDIEFFVFNETKLFKGGNNLIEVVRRRLRVRRFNFLQ